MREARVRDAGPHQIQLPEAGKAAQMLHAGIGDGCRMKVQILARHQLANELETTIGELGGSGPGTSESVHAGEVLHAMIAEWRFAYIESPQIHEGRQRQASSSSLGKPELSHIDQG